mmetsp:Transcript_38377/g.69161  ORF Transcript_38377/g.69161 Transcript_38377/m.69161 type:complete len:296 (+) Transcript_38377:327-1214(+)
MRFDDGTVGGHDRVDSVLGECKQFIGLAVVQVVEEDATQSTSFITVGDDKVFVRPGFELGVELRIVSITHLLVRSMEMLHVILVEVRGSKVGTAAEPPNATIRLEVPVVEMHGRTMGITGMHHTRQTTREEGHPFSRSHALGPIHSPLGRRLQCLLGHGSIHNTEIHSGLFEDGSVFEDAGHATASVGADPAVFLEGGLAIDCGDGVGDGDLGLADHFLEFGAHGVVAVGAVTRTDEGVGRLVHGLMRIPSKIHSGSIRGLLPIDILTVGKLSCEEGALEGFLFEGGGGSSFEAG